MAETAKNLGWAIGLMLLANLFFAFVDTSTKWLISVGFLALQLAFIRYLMHFVITVVDMRRNKLSEAPLTGRQKVIIVIRAFCIISGTVANFIALGHLPLAVSSAILYLSPVLVCLISGLFLSERLKFTHWLAILAGFAGVLIVIRPFGEDVNWYAALMLYPATVFALYAILTRQLAGQVSPARMQFATGALGTLVLFPVALFNWHTPQSLLEWALYLAIGALAWAGHEALTRAHAYAPASTLMPFGYSFVIYLTIAGWLVFGHVPDGPSVLGAFIISCAGLAIWKINRAD